MAFHSFPFLLFLPICIAGYYLLAKVLPDVRKSWLLACSLAFYAFGGLHSLPFLAASVLFNYWISEHLGPESSHSARWLKIGVVCNLGLLAACKYLTFALANVNALARTHWTVAAIFLPLGISFFTVQQIMYLVDRHQGIVPPQKFLDYALFVAWFPYIVAGPITRAPEVIPQLQKEAAGFERSEMIGRGAIRFALGLIKKVALSDAFAGWVDSGFAHPTGLGWAGAWIVAICYALQIYLDFSAYTDMACGAALMLGVKLPENFNNPFRALGVIEYWQRWHISLTNFITNYIYMPILRRKRPTFRRAMVATVIAVTIAGIWHGAAWTYLFYGLWHGLGLLVNHMWRKSKRHLAAPVSWGLTAIFLLIAFVFFRASSLSNAAAFLHSMFVPGKLIGTTILSAARKTDTVPLLGMLLGFVTVLVPTTAARISLEWPLRPLYAAAAAACVYLAMVLINSQTAAAPFIYQQF